MSIKDPEILISYICMPQALDNLIQYKNVSTHRCDIED